LLRRFKTLNHTFTLGQEGLMTIQKKLAPALVLLALGAMAGLAFFGSQRMATAEPNATASIGTAKAACEDRLVEVDEGYGISRKEKRRVCR
jgi:hypothetical protein